MKGKKEAAIKAAIMLAVSKIQGVRIFNVPTGEGWLGRVISRTGGFVTLAYPQRVTYGLTVGGSDLVGWTSITVTPDMIGRRVAIFTAIEVKREQGGRVSPAQKNFIEQVKRAGGIAVIANNEKQAESAILSFRGGENE